VGEEEEEDDDEETKRTGDDVNIFIRSLRANSADFREVDVKEDEWFACKERGSSRAVE